MTLSAPVLENGPEDPPSEHPIERIAQLIEHWRSQGDVCAQAGRITAATQYRNFADALENTLGRREDELVSVVVTVTDGEPKMAVSATAARGGLKDWMIEEILQDAVRAVQTRKSVESTVTMLGHALV
ncbi:hypothetical protein [Rhodococcus rhodochrous]|uniref:hypothetical protein n=1 Tax=Rhodococcus rhodochrous TaxID=1829 RepID=UPI00177B5B2B|nr:hypothetical protein [Rhodococcus rhodochrous]QOH59824.1 hypothetical protein C6Y44_27410 [Rhodococcus rhodochrous]